MLKVGVETIMADSPTGESDGHAQLFIIEFASHYTVKLRHFIWEIYLLYILIKRH